MAGFLAVWIVGAAAAFAVAWAARSWLKGRFTRPWRMHLPGLVVLCVLAGAATALVHDWLSPRPVVLPPELAQTPALGKAGPR